MSLANEKQVGGDHYRTAGLQVWDLFGPEFLIGNIARYISRWRKKNGVQDLEKGKHFVEKLREVAPRFRGNSYQYGVGDAAIQRWINNAGLNQTEQDILEYVFFFWRHDASLGYAIAGIDYLIAEANNQ